MASRRCIFCGAGGKLTTEHVFPKWLLADIKKAGFGPPTQQPVWTEKSRPNGQPDEEVHETRRRMSPHGIDLAKCVCKTCNGGWMSRELEIPFSKAFRRLVRHEQTPLDLRLMARWALKTAMVADAGLSTGQLFTQEDRDMVRIGQTPPSTDVRFSFHPGSNASTGFGGSDIYIDPHPPFTPATGSLSVLFAGPLRFLIRRSDTPPGYLLLLAATNHFARHWGPLTIPVDPFESLRAHSYEEIDAFLADPKATGLTDTASHRRWEVAQR